jgi:hypothetical protein
MHSNAEFKHLYRDASNYKFRNSIIFANPFAISLEEADKWIQHLLGSQVLFIASQIRVPEMFPFLNDEPTEDDHCYHEFASIRPTTEAQNDTYGRSIAEFVKEIEGAERHGWRVFDPRYMT